MNLWGKKDKEKDDTCRSCRGSGNCDFCSGTGSWAGKPCTYCGGTGNCSSCGGTGKK